MSAHIHPREAIISRGLAALTEVAHTTLVARLNLRRVPVPSQLATLAGQFRGQSLTMQTQAFCGHGFSRLVLSTITGSDGAVKTFTLIGTPTPDLGLPVVGIDLIAMNRALSLVAVDLSPTDEQRWQNLAAPILQELHASVADRSVPRRWPAFARDVFSPLALICGAKRGEEPVLFAAISLMLERYANAIAQQATPISPARARVAEYRSHQWAAGERQNRREHDALTAIFGEPGTLFLAYLFGESGQEGRGDGC